MKNTAVTFKQAKEKKEKLTMLTAYDYSTAKLIDEAGINAILVGDSLGMVVLGYEDTLSVTMEDMIHHSAAVSRGIKDTLLITDMPFMSYQTSVYDAVVNAGRLVKEGHAQAVKLEGGREVCPQIKAIVDASIPVCAHLGLTPQSVNAFGGFKVQGKGEEAAQKLLDEARAVEEAGAFAVVLECVPKALAKKITESISIPTIGIGAGADCDGQVLVYQDMLAMYANMKPKKERNFSMNEMMKVLYIQVGKKPQVIEIKHTLKEMQRLVGGIISAYSPFDDGSVIILNDTGKIDGLEFNRVVYDENGEIADIIAGDFFICYASPDRPDFSSLPDELIRKYSELFKTPKSFIRIDGKLIIMPAGDQQ